MPSIFINYNRKDKSFAGNLAKKLTESGVRVWFDEDGLRVRKAFIQNIPDAISVKKYIMPIISSDSVMSFWVQKGLAAAMSSDVYGGRILPIIIDRCNIPRFIQDKIYVDFSNPYKFDESFSVMLTAIGAVKHRVLSKTEQEAERVRKTAEKVRREEDARKKAFEVDEIAKEVRSFVISKRNLEDFGNIAVVERNLGEARKVFDNSLSEMLTAISTIEPTVMKHVYEKEKNAEAERLAEEAKHKIEEAKRVALTNKEAEKARRLAEVKIKSEEARKLKEANVQAREAARLAEEAKRKAEEARQEFDSSFIGVLGNIAALEPKIRKDFEAKLQAEKAKNIAEAEVNTAKSDMDLLA